MDSTPAKAPPPNPFAYKFFWQKGSCGSEETYLYYQVTEQSTEQITGGIAGGAIRPLLISSPHAILFDTPVTGMPWTGGTISQVLKLPSNDPYFPFISFLLSCF